MRQAFRSFLDRLNNFEGDIEHFFEEEDFYEGDGDELDLLDDELEFESEDLLPDDFPREIDQNPEFETESNPEPEDKSIARGKLGLNQHKSYVLFSGSFTNRIKNAVLAREAVELLDDPIELIELRNYSRDEAWADAKNWREF